MIYKFKEFKDEPLLINHLNMGGKNPKGEEINVTSRYFTRNGKPWIGVMGEFHFSRYGRENWHRELAKMKAGGITIVSTYLFWIYHEEIEGKMDFGGDNDIRAFIEECKDVGLDVVIRIGPWAHGECRNGAFPDWLLKKDYKLRDNNEEYLAVVKKWYQSIYNEVKGLFYKDGGNIIAVQIENEFVDNAEHLAKLKEIAVECGFIAPIYTVTGWNSASGAKIPVDEVVPVFGGYCEAPWENHMNRLSPSPHYFFNRMRNDSAIGTDLIAKNQSDGWQLPYERYPFATCELGGGIEVTHHRRPIIKPMDIYAVSLVKLGDGNNLVGYYMYHGGTNKIGELSTFNETKATGYPNDYPILSYDFQAPLSEYGEVREQYGLLNMLHMFVNDFGEEFAPMIAVDFFAEIPNIKAEYKFSKGSANIVTVPFENAKYMRKLNGTVYIGGGCNLYEENGQIYSVEDGEYICQKWNGSEFETLTIVQSAKQSNVEITGVENAPFEPKYKEELCIGGERELTWKKINVDGGYGFAEIDYVGDVAQIYADGELVADDYYYGKTWRVPCKLLYGKECYMVISEMKEDFYKEF